MMCTRGASAPYLSAAPIARPIELATPTPEAPVASLTNGVAGVGCPSSARAPNSRKSGVAVIGLRRNPSRSSRRRRCSLPAGSSAGSATAATSSRSAHMA